MGGGILPATILNNKLYFLFGKENCYENNAHGFSDFGGGKDSKESLLDTAIREACEEFTGFLGSREKIKNLIKRNYKIDYHSNEYNTYRTHIFYLPYDEKLVYYFNNNHNFLIENLSKKIFKSTTIFEKSEIKWICIDDLLKMKKEFRPYFLNIINIILHNKDDIIKFVMDSKNLQILKKLKRTKKLKISKKYKKTKKNRYN